MLSELGRVWLSRAGTMAQRDYQILQGIPRGSAEMCLGSWQRVGSSCTLCFRGPLPLLGFSCLATGISWSCRMGAMAATTPWEGASGGGKVTLAAWAGTGELDE